MKKRAEAVLGIPSRWIGLVLPAILFSLGCGGPTGDVSGKVTYLGKPLPEGSVTFVDAENRVVGSSPLSTDGDYSVIKVPAGPVKITVTVTGPPVPWGKGKGKGIDNSKSKLVYPPKGATPPEGGNPEAPKWKVLSPRPPNVAIPDKYKMPDQSGLTYTVQPGKQEYTIDLK
jgi:hypothetical protein